MKKGALFNTVPVQKPTRNMFDLSHEVKMSGKMGILMPFLLEDTIPGDIFKQRAEIMARMAPMLAPIMHRVDLKTEYFFVPNRLLWDEFEDFITGGPEGTAAPVPPHVTGVLIDGLDDFLCAPSSLWDYFGLPTFADGTNISTVPISSLPFRAYTLIYNEYYRDQNLQTEIPIAKTSGIETSTQIENCFILRYRAWEKDYFTSALPWTQRGVEASLPFEINYKEVSTAHYFDDTGTSQLSALASGEINAPTLTSGLKNIRIENIEEDSLIVTVNELRRTVRLQEWLEANARGGARYTEQIYVHFGERVPDYRLQRPEYLGGSKQPMVISEVLATASNQAEDNGNVGDLAGHGLSVSRTSGFSYKCVEHGWIIGLLSIIPKPAYQNGVQRKWLRNDKFDYFWKQFANIGEQAIQNMELFYNPASDTNNTTAFGYTPRYAEYKYSSDRVSGAFRDTLSYWHMGRDFTTLPALNANFVSCNPFAEGLNRIFYVTTDIDNIWIQIYNNTRAYRPMPYFGVPSI